MPHRRILLAASAFAQGEAARTLRMVPQADVTVLDPLATTSHAVRNHAYLCWDTLYGLDTAFRPQPQLTKGHVVGDESRRWSFTLREGPTFHDGKAIRAADAVASIRRWMARDTHGQTLAARLESIRAALLHGPSRWRCRPRRRRGSSLRSGSATQLTV